ncbi:MAG: glycoside hydrolase family 97 C-terminal domain-containing protein [Kiritimatiellae bacterium]|nr:glycoside hydrolase family 97 C-terminal domain-containing protein [Kiritimatiellia bacterium]
MTLFSGPLQMLCDSPAMYSANQECFDFMAKTPTVWSETRAVAGEIGKNIAVVRKTADGAYHVAAICDWDGWNVSIPLDFLPEGEYDAEAFMDEAASAEEPQKYVHKKFKVCNGGRLDLSLAPGGGAAIKIKQAHP